MENNKSWKDVLAEFGNSQKKVVQNTVQNENRVQNITAFRDENNNYVGAPYNFIPFTPKQYEYPKKHLPMHDDIEDDLISGEIVYEMKAETDIFVDDGTDAHHFYKNARGQYSIPGSSVRGLFRTNVQILSFSSFEDDIDDYALMFRNVAGSSETNKDEYTAVIGDSELISLGRDPMNDQKEIKVNVLKKVKAGYICKENGQYFIYKTCVDVDEAKEDRNYYVLSEKTIIGEYKKYQEQIQRENDALFAYDFFIQNDKYLQNKKECIGEKNGSYKPYYQNISYKVHQQMVTSVRNLEKNEEDALKGVVVSSGYMRKKKVVYIVPDIDKTKKPILISRENEEAFKADFEKRKNTLGEEKDFFDLPQDENPKPVFYIEVGGKLYFGFTPRLRVFYEYTIKDGLPNVQKNGTLDFAKAMFGYSKNQESYKSRLSFSDAVIKESLVREKASKEVVLAEPKPTSYLDYLNQKKEQGVITYNNADFQLHGVKQYWLHQNAYENVNGLTNNNKKIKSVINALPVGTVFIGTVRFKNLTKQELGLLLWAIRLEKDSQMNIGKAKAYGYGRISVKIKKAKQIDLQKSYKSTGVLDIDPFNDISVDDVIIDYKNFIIKKCGLEKKIEKNPRIRDFLLMKNFIKIPQAEDIRYMELKEYEKRKNKSDALPRVNEIVNKNR